MCSTLPLPLCGGSWNLSGYQEFLASLPRTHWTGHSQMYVQYVCCTVQKKIQSSIINTVWNLNFPSWTELNWLFCFPVVDDVHCTLCDSPGDLLDQLFCTSCGQHYHGICLDMAVTPLRRAGWQCPECKICQTCKWVSFPPTDTFVFTFSC